MDRPDRVTPLVREHDIWTMIGSAGKRECAVWLKPAGTPCFRLVHGRPAINTAEEAAPDDQTTRSNAAFGRIEEISNRSSWYGIDRGAISVFRKLLWQRLELGEGLLILRSSKDRSG